MCPNPLAAPVYLPTAFPSLPNPLPLAVPVYLPTAFPSLPATQRQARHPHPLAHASGVVAPISSPAASCCLQAPPSRLHACPNPLAAPVRCVPMPANSRH
ncbi:hypothetical protein COCNU_07G011550 [Cocos nucifera]|uniref:Uncharacterized protein n=1 Tax=Cocos nucifera TaxID=13894 RepID=A0A8K0IFW8_COCNU|nr:hypothetical protein COCNU_07G011550 [Cocos nucifera]